MAIPRSTYRLQITPSFDLFAAADQCDYLATLGIDGVYLSPLLTSTTGSDHGYDVVRFDEIDPARGGRPGWDAFLAAARKHRLKVIVDIVPNHTGVAVPIENPAWWDLLRLGAQSEYARWFDVDWTDGRIRIPVLGDDFTPEQLSLVDGPSPELRYFEHRYPLAPGSADDGADAATVHARQHYELVSHRRADAEQNYRRFFAVADLAGLRVEDPAVFDATHVEIARWLREDGIDGLRVDHPDGLADPVGYLQRLRELAGPDVWILVEKILQPGEELPDDWPVDGTTGYEVLGQINYEITDRAGLIDRKLIDRWAVLGLRETYPEVVAASKREIATTILRAEVLRLARLVPDVPAADEALTELLVVFPVYRTYLPAGREYLDTALTAARAARPELAGAFDALEPRLADPSDELCVRFQQATGAVMAKGVEDTAFYRYNEFIALNEVGGDPVGTPPPWERNFDSSQQRRLEHWPNSMTTLSTHDTKRSEDVRAALHAINDFSSLWADALIALHRARPLPDPSFTPLFWQTVVATSQNISPPRLHGYFEKAMREASRSTSWSDPNPEFEGLVHALLDDCADDPVIFEQIEQLCESVPLYGQQVSLGQKLIQLTLPGVPDVYQGTEIWSYTLVDPDNRRPVDYLSLRGLLTELDAVNAPPGVEEFGLAKLWITTRALRLRRDRPDLFTSYRPVRANDPDASEYHDPLDEDADSDGELDRPEPMEPNEFLIAFDRGGAVTVATRGPNRLDQLNGWGDRTLDLVGDYVDVLTGERYRWPIRLADLLSWYPVALLVPADRL